VGDVDQGIAARVRARLCTLEQNAASITCCDHGPGSSITMRVTVTSTSLAGFQSGSESPSSCMTTITLKCLRGLAPPYLSDVLYVFPRSTERRR